MTAVFVLTTQGITNVVKSQKSGFCPCRLLLLLSSSVFHCTPLEYCMYVWMGVERGDVLKQKRMENSDTENSIAASPRTSALPAAPPYHFPNATVPHPIVFPPPTLKIGNNKMETGGGGHVFWETLPSPPPRPPHPPRSLFALPPF